MNQMTDRLLVDWLSEGPDRGPVQSLERALAATRRTSQRPGWTILERWIPMQLTMRPAFQPAGMRRLFIIASVALLALAVAATFIFIGSRQQVAPPFGLAANGSVVVDVDGDLWVVDPAGGAPHRLDIGMGRSVAPVFSHDGTKFAFMSRPRIGVPSALFVANADGSQARSLTGGLRIATSDVAGITWSPDGSTLIFHSSDRGIDRLYRVGVDGSGLQAMSDKTADRSYPTWSPDGQWIAYRMRPVDTIHKTYLAISRPDGSDERTITSAPDSKASFSGSQWTADSQRLVYFRSSEHGHVVGMADLAGTETLLSPPLEDSYNPVMSPDGLRVVITTSSAAAVVELNDPSKRLDLPGNLAGCGAMWAPDATALIGLSFNCDELYRIPLDDVGAATKLQLPDGAINNVAWQRLAP
jgi:Tol biopolymer transport system component